MIGSINSSTSASMMSGMSGRGRMQRPDPAEMASQIFSQLDTKNQGYIEKTDLASAFAALQENGGTATGSAATSDVEALFSQLDSDSDGKVTEDEFSSSMQQLADALDSQFNQMRMEGHGMHGGGKPPPPPADDTGFSREELSSQLQSIGSTDSERASLISQIVENFSEADSDGDGKVSFAEAQAFDQKQQGSTSISAGAGSSTASDSSGDSGAAASSDTAQARLMRQIMQLMHAYGRPSEDAAFSSLLQTSA